MSLERILREQRVVICCGSGGVGKTTTSAVLALHAALRKSRLTGEDGEALLERFLAQWFDGVPIETAEELEL